jgi:uncharacterized protein (DUF305 family)
MTRASRAVGVLLMAGVLAACSAEPPQPPTNSAPVIVPGKPGEEASTIPPGQATPLEEEAPNEADVTFVRDMIVHHAQAVELADLAPERADRKDVAGLADRIADTQRPEIDMLNRWLKLHEQPEVDPAGHGASHAGMPGMATSDQVDQLRQARGANFDRLFLQLMITHHEGALTMVEEVRRAGVNGRVQEIADDVAVVQSDEIHRMRGMQGG